MKYFTYIIVFSFFYNSVKAQVSILQDKQINSHSRGNYFSFSSDDKFIVRGDFDGNIKVVDFFNGNIVLQIDSAFKNERILNKHKTLGVVDAFLSCVSFSRDGSKIIASNEQGIVKVWNISDGKLLKTILYKGADNSNNISNFKLSADGRFLIVAYENNARFSKQKTFSEVLIYEMKTFSLVKSFNTNLEFINEIQISNNNKFVCCSGGGFIKLFDFNSGKLIKQIVTDKSEYPTGPHIVINEKSNVLYFFIKKKLCNLNLDNLGLQEIGDFDYRDKEILQFQISFDGKYLLHDFDGHEPGNGRFREFIIWDIKNGINEIIKENTTFPYNDYGFCFANNSTGFITGVYDNKNYNVDLIAYKLNALDSKKPQIEWIFPATNLTVIEDPKVTIKAIIKSETEIIGTQLLIDNIIYKNRDFEIVQNDDKKSFVINFSKQISFEGKVGQVEISIKSSNNSGETFTSRIIEIKKDIVVKPITPPLQKEKRLALIIGNSDYANGNSLTNPKNDADSIESVLNNLGFEVIKKKNLTLQQTNSVIQNFSQQLKSYDIGLFFYAGHGIELEGNNYIIPIDADKLDKSDVQYKCINTSWLQDKMAEAGAYNKTNIIILDACRNNPFRGWRSFSGDEDVWTPSSNIPSGLITAFAASQGQRAADGNGTNGLYTSVLLKYIRTKGIKIEDLFKKVRAELIRLGGQKPIENTSLTKDFYFVPQQ